MKKIILIPALVGVLGVGVVMGSTSLLSGNAEANKALSVQEIEKKAIDIVNGTVKSIEFDKEHTGDVYEVEIITETEEHDLLFDAYTGKLLRQKKELLDDDDRFIQTGNNTAGYITKEQAIEKALSKAKGTVKKVELDDGIYEVELTDGQFEYDVEILATTGEIIKFEQDFED